MNETFGHLGSNENYLHNVEPDFCKPLGLDITSGAASANYPLLLIILSVFCFPNSLLSVLSRVCKLISDHYTTIEMLDYPLTVYGI